MPTSIVSLTTYKAYSGIAVTTDDTALTVLLTAAEAFLRRLCGRNLDTGFLTGTYTEDYDGRDDAVIQLKEVPVTSITSVKLRANDGTLTTYATTDYRCELATGMLYRLGATDGRFPSGGFADASASDFPTDPMYQQWKTEPSWPMGFQNIQVVYVCTVSSVPADLTWVVCRLTDQMFANSRTNPSLQSETFGSYAYARRAWNEVSGELEGLVMPFRRGTS